MNEFLHSELFAVTLTVGLFWGAQLLQKRLKSIILNPILVAIILIIVVLKMGDISYETYYAGGKYVEFLLKPAIVALGVPLYLQIEQIRKQAFPILACQLVGCIVGATSAYLIGPSPWCISGCRDLTCAKIGNDPDRHGSFQTDPVAYRL